MYVCMIMHIFRLAPVNVYHYNITFLANLERSTVLLFARQILSISCTNIACSLLTLIKSMVTCNTVSI